MGLKQSCQTAMVVPILQTCLPRLTRSSVQEAEPGFEPDMCDFPSQSVSRYHLKSFFMRDTQLGLQQTPPRLPDFILCSALGLHPAQHALGKIVEGVAHCDHCSVSPLTLLTLTHISWPPRCLAPGLTQNLAQTVVPTLPSEPYSRT